MLTPDCAAELVLIRPLRVQEEEKAVERAHQKAAEVRERANQEGRAVKVKTRAVQREVPEKEKGVMHGLLMLLATSSTSRHRDVLLLIAVGLGMTLHKLRPIPVRDQQHPLQPVLPVTEVNRPVVNQAKESMVAERASKVARLARRARASPLLMQLLLVRRSGRRKAKEKRWPLPMRRSQT